jgi:hypothetical protein
MGQLARFLLGIPAREIRRAERALGPETGEIRDRFLALGKCFADGYHAALLDPRPEPLAARLAGIERELQGFAYEGAGMGLLTLDILAPRGNWRGRHGRHDQPGRRGRLSAFGAGSPQAYMLHVGAGWAMARLPVRPRRLLARLDPLLGWMTLDGLGFQTAFFRRAETIERGEVPARISGYARRPFDIGVGRSLWFLERADARRVGEAIARFPAERQGDLWTGVGEAAAYAGGNGREGLEALRRAAEPYLPYVAQGAAFSAETRERAVNPAPHTELASRLLCGTTAVEAAAIARGCAADLPPDDAVLPAFEIWRQRIRQRFARARAISELTSPPIRMANPVR